MQIKYNSYLGGSGMHRIIAWMQLYTHNHNITDLGNNGRLLDQFCLFNGLFNHLRLNWSRLLSQIAMPYA